MKDKLLLIIWFMLAVVLIGYVVYTSWLYYKAPCTQIRDFPMSVQVPNRCIKE